MSQIAEPTHVHVALGTPGLAGDVPEPGADQQERGVAVGEGTDDAGASPDLAHDPFEGIVRTQ